jgi:hypothetical protein
MSAIFLEKAFGDGKFSIELFDTYCDDFPYRVNIYDWSHYAGELLISKGFETLPEAQSYYNGKN